ncbi:palmitoyltransferase zdhhc17 [Chrysochromulina tobinii]|uniref:Palmitoyltransferase n=1 Tax=Chrysochromulina tobinii TaxID=1460289 RepID=A0A0M0J9Z2_9EUKA|nr:palmitoyltransferase zdhhc17 [Chrysochromulina tobinii]|eukprot:KOO23310.1 palmitoyltransferase zdhhc17 [Chrysochromulina sp. CCMP291]
MTLLDGSGSDGDVECRALRGRGQPNVEDDLAALPPLPEQDLCQMRAEASCGNSLVLFLIFLFVAPMQAYANTQANLTMLQRAWIFAIYAEAATAIFCLLGLMWDDPGTIKRTAENCFPLPDIVAEKLANGQSLESVGNVTGEDGRVFCIRCLVWRPDDGGNTHHCSTCQRCVCEFDHHCGVFGRCIAGDGCGGNMGYFKTLILMGVLGCGTCVSFMVVSSAPSGSYPRHRVG